MTDEAARSVHEALADYLDEGEIAISWCLTIDVASADGTRYLAHRAGGGVDGTEAPTVWAAMGMLRSSVLTAEQQMVDCTEDAEDEDEE